MEDYILKWCSFFCVVPSFDKRSFRFKPRCCQVFVFVFAHVLLVFLIVLSLFLSLNSLFEFAYSLIMYVNSIYSTLNLCLFKVDKLESLIQNLKLLQLQVNGQSTGASKVALLGFVAVNLIVLIPYLPWYALFTGNVAGVPIAILAEIPTYIMHLQGILQIYLLYSIKDKLKSINGCIPKLHEQTDLIISTNKFYATICTSLASFNELFGWTILLHLVTFFISLIRHLYYLISFIKLEQYGLTLAFFMPKVLIKLLQVVVLSKVCQDLLQENDVSFKNLVLVLSTVKDESARKQLLALKQDVNIYRPRVSAAGFFDVNHAMLFMLFNLMITYLIAMGQLM